jgi:hypothetical protein
MTAKFLQKLSTLKIFENYNIMTIRSFQNIVGSGVIYYNRKMNAKIN